MTRIKWEVSEELWSFAEGLIPARPSSAWCRRPGGGRKGTHPRIILSAILYVLRTGIQWKALPREKFGIGGSSVHQYFREWSDAGFFEELWRAGLEKYDEVVGIEWEWQSADGATFKAPLGREAVGPNPTDRGKKRQQKTSSR